MPSCLSSFADPRRPYSQPTTLYSLLTAATKAHNTYTRDASTGRGSDRHFLGLKAMLREGESHALLDDPLFQQSQDWVLSTSGLSAGDRFYGTGFGTIWENGYGVNCALFASFLTPNRSLTCPTLLSRRPRRQRHHQVWYRVEALVRRDVDRGVPQQPHRGAEGHEGRVRTGAGPRGAGCQAVGGGVEGLYVREGVRSI